MSCEQINPQVKRKLFKYKNLSIEKLELLKKRRFENKLRAFKRQKEKQYAFRNNFSLVRFSNRCGNHINCFKFNLSENKAHILKKLEICIDLLKNNHKFISEAIFDNGCRCDVFDITSGTVYEILNSETDEEFEEKIKKYPREVEVVKVKI